MLKMIKLNKKHIEMLLIWRKQARVQNAMITQIDHSIEQQLEWFNRINIDSTKNHWLITTEGKPIGALNLDDIDYINQKCTASFYIGEPEYSSLGAVVLPCLYNYIFKSMGFRKVYGNVVSSNKVILKIHEMHGYRKVGFYEKHIKKEGELLDIVIVELMATSWLSKKKYSSYEAIWE
jgi:UDP-4-amino-4,6-dideoxy-N-acetyl-beta-L-altrosamine N-acetyltransferase